VESPRFYRSHLEQKKDYNTLFLAERNCKGFFYIVIFFQPMAHTQHDCTYHIVFCPKYHKKIIYGKFKTQLGSIINEILKQMKIDKIEGHLSKDHIHLQLRIPPSLAVSTVV
jgi:Transposase IS200 like